MRTSQILENHKKLNFRRKQTLLIQNNSNINQNIISKFKKMSREKLVSKYKKTAEQINEIKIENILKRKKSRLVSLYIDSLFCCDPCEFLVRYNATFISRIKIKQLSSIQALSVKLFPCYSKLGRSYQFIISKYLLLKQNLIDFHENLKKNRNDMNISYNSILNTKFYDSLDKSSKDKSKVKIQNSLSKSYLNTRQEESYQSIKNLIKKIDTCENELSLSKHKINFRSSPSKNDQDILDNFLITATKTVTKTYSNEVSIQNLSGLESDKMYPQKKFKENSEFIKNLRKRKLKDIKRSEIIFEIQKDIKKEEYNLKKKYKKKIPEKINKLALISTCLSEINSSNYKNLQNRIIHCNIGETYTKFLFYKNEEKIKKLNNYKTKKPEKPYKFKEVLKSIDIQNKRSSMIISFKASN
jgi:hypothetical protein